jgi:hypothetical protein
MSSVRFRQAVAGAMRWLRHQPEGTTVAISTVFLSNTSCSCGNLPRQECMGWNRSEGPVVWRGEFMVALRDGKPYHVACGQEIKI